MERRAHRSGSHRRLLHPHRRTGRRAARRPRPRCRRRGHLRPDQAARRAARGPLDVPVDLAGRGRPGRHLAHLLERPHHRAVRPGQDRRGLLRLRRRPRTARGTRADRHAAGLAAADRDPLRLHPHRRRRHLDRHLLLTGGPRQPAAPVGAAQLRHRAGHERRRPRPQRGRPHRRVGGVGARRQCHAHHLGPPADRPHDRAQRATRQPRRPAGARRPGVLGPGGAGRAERGRGHRADRPGHRGARRLRRHRPPRRVRGQRQTPCHQRPLAGARPEPRLRHRQPRYAVGGVHRHRRPCPHPRGQLPRRPAAALVDALLGLLDRHGRLVRRRPRCRAGRRHRPGPAHSQRRRRRGGRRCDRRPLRRRVRARAAPGGGRHRTGRPGRLAVGVPEGDLLRRQHVHRRRHLPGLPRLPLPLARLPAAAAGTAAGLRGTRRLAQGVRRARPRLGLPQRDRAQRRQRGGHAGRGVREHAHHGRRPAPAAARSRRRLLRRRALPDPAPVGRVPRRQRPRPRIPEPDRRLHRLHRAQRQPRAQGHRRHRRHERRRRLARQHRGRRPLPHPGPLLRQPVDLARRGLLGRPPQTRLRPGRHLEPEVQRLPRPAARPRPGAHRHRGPRGRLVRGPVRRLRRRPRPAQRLHQGRLGAVDRRLARRPPRHPRPTRQRRLQLREHLTAAGALQRLVRGGRRRPTRLPGPAGGRRDVRAAAAARPLHRQLAPHPEPQLGQGARRLRHVARRQRRGHAVRGQRHRRPRLDAAGQRRRDRADRQPQQRQGPRRPRPEHRRRRPRPAVPGQRHTRPRLAHHRQRRRLVEDRQRPVGQGARRRRHVAGRRRPGHPVDGQRHRRPPVAADLTRLRDRALSRAPARRPATGACAWS
ncbi:hypothetical protein SBRY_70202 [Actinacidiphila bryophytorum]|uniref:Uncharacterized protein n=1 Tax=Actinacidiphila bryophytorum TaxID=1436133 RepID=A0A9W4MKI9_9ACTN|nr:hypothetical protein SBRY_70202 [Actinacidiphila bryophytorum]